MIWMIAPNILDTKAIPTKTVTLEPGEDPEDQTSQKPPQRYCMWPKTI